MNCILYSWYNPTLFIYFTLSWDRGSFCHLTLPFRQFEPVSNAWAWSMLRVSACMRCWWHAPVSRGPRSGGEATGPSLSPLRPRLRIFSVTPAQSALASPAPHNWPLVISWSDILSFKCTTFLKEWQHANGQTGLGYLILAFGIIFLLNHITKRKLRLYFQLNYLFVCMISNKKKISHCMQCTDTFQPFVSVSIPCYNIKHGVFV